MSAAPEQPGDSPRGLAYAIGAYAFWGFLPIYMKAVAHIPAPEVVAHRVIWSVPIALMVLVATGRTADLTAALRRPRLIAMAALTAALITLNWLIYVWAVGHGQTIETALGYYINPLFSIFLAAVLLGERLNRAQWLAIALAGAAVLLLTIEAGSLPAVALGLTFSWGFYAYFKRSLPLGPNQGFTLEVLVLLPLAVAALIWFEREGTGHFLGGTMRDKLLLIGCGPVTAVPLMVYANGAKLIRLSTMGILQYIAPTLIFLTAVLLFGEPFEGARLIAFPMIWAALLMYSLALVREARSRRQARDAVAAAATEPL